MTVFTVDVDYTDRTRDRDGRFVTVTTRVPVMADDDIEATLVAAQMVAGRVRDELDGMVTGTRVVL